MTMRTFGSIEEWRRERAGQAAFFAVGNFDGVHLGHQKIFHRLTEQARAAGEWAVALTFDPHPLKLLRPETAPPLITTLARRLGCFESAGLDATVILPFTREFAALTPEAFAERILGQALHASAVFVGENFRFGHRQTGDATLLVRLGERLGFRVNIVESVHVRGELVSSTLVRQAIEAGRVERAGRMLGRPFALTGQIRPGTGQGRKLVVPTLNLAWEEELLPARGVYATQALVQGELYRAATNIGYRPTFDGGKLVVESHLLQFSGEINSGPMELRFWKRLREERKFPSPTELRRQVLKDIDRSRRFFDGLDSRRATASAGS